MGTAISKEQIEQTYEKINRMNALLKQRGADYVIQVYKQARPEKSATVDEVLKRSDTDYVAKAIIDSYRPKTIPAPQKAQPIAPTQQAIPTQPEQEKPSILQWGAKAITEPIQKLNEPGTKAARQMRTGYRAMLGVLPKIADVKDAFYDNKQRTPYFRNLINKGLMPTEAKILNEFGQEEGQKFINDIRRTFKSVDPFSAENTRMARGEMGSRTNTTNLLRVIGEELVNVPADIVNPEAVTVPTNLAANLFIPGIGGKIGTGIVKGMVGKEGAKWVENMTVGNYVKKMAQGDFPIETAGGNLAGSLAQQQAYLSKALSKQVKSVIRQAGKEGIDLDKVWAGLDPKTMTGIDLKKGLANEITRRYAKKDPTRYAKWKQAINGIKTAEFDNLAGGVREGIELEKVVTERQDAGVEYAPTGEEIRAGKKPTVAPVRGAMPSGTTEPITKVRGVEQVQPLVEPSAQKAGMTAEQLRAKQEQEFADLFPDVTAKTLEKPTMQPIEVQFNKNTGYYIPGVSHGDKFKLSDGSTVDVNIVSSGQAGFDGSLLTGQDYMVDINTVKAIVKPDGTEIPVINNLKKTPEKTIETQPEIKATEIPQEQALQGEVPKEPYEMRVDDYIHQDLPDDLRKLYNHKARLEGLANADDDLVFDYLNKLEKVVKRYTPEKLDEFIELRDKFDQYGWTTLELGDTDAYLGLAHDSIYERKYEQALQKEYELLPRDVLYKEHRASVQKAIDEGKIKSHPDYPDLAKTVQKEPTKPLSAEQRVVASGKELTPQAVVDEMKPYELEKVVSIPKDEYIHQDLSPEAYAVFTHKVRKEGFENPLVTDRNIKDYLGKVKKITDFDNNPSEYGSIYEDIYAEKPRYAEARKKIEKLLGIEHDKAIATAGKMDKGTRTLFDETVHTYATRKVKATTPEPKAETLDLTIARPDEVVLPEDLIRRFMDRNGYTREEAIEDIRKHGGFASFGFKQKPSLAQNPSKVNDDVINQYADGISMETEKEKFGMGKVWQSFHTLYNWTVHRRQPIAQITNFARKGGTIPAGEAPDLLAARYSGVEKIASEKIFKETRMRNPDGSSTVTGKGLAQVLEPVTQDIKDFSAYLAAERDIELMSRDVAIKGSPKQAEAYKTINAIKNKYGTNFKVFEDTAQGFRDWTKRAMLDELKDIGFLSQKNYDDILDSNRFYAPFQRLMDIAERRGVIPSSKEAFTPQGKPIHKIVGSERQVIDPLENAITNCYKITDFINRQRVSNAAIRLRDIDPRLQTIIKPGRGKYEIPVYENGIRKLYNVPKDLHTALKGMDEADVGELMRIVSFPTKTLRAGATLIPEFWFRNPIRDQFTAFVNAKYGFYPGVDFIKGMFHTLRKDDLYHEWLASGADHSMFVSLDRMTARTTLQDVLRGRPKYWSPKHPIEAVRALSELFERGTRVGVYGRARSGGDILYRAFHKGKATVSELEAMMESREATTDFARRGSQTKAMNQLIAFWNANVQGIDKMVRTFKDRPLEASIRAISSIAIPTITLYMINKDNPRYKELPQWEKDFFWIIIPSDTAPIIRIPKPFELGILFGTSAEHIIDYIEKRDPEAVKTLGNSAWQALTPGVIPTGLQPPIESWANKNLFTNRPIVPSIPKKLSPELQYESYSSEVAKAVGTWIKYSPLKIDNAIRGYFGGMGKYATDSIDFIIKKYGAERPPEPTKTLADIPLIRGFIAREPIGSISESVNKFYKAYSEIEQANNDIKHYQKQGNIKKVTEYTQKHPEARFMSGFTTVLFSMAKARRVIQSIYDDKKMSPGNKRKAIDELNTLITRQAALALDVYNNAKKGEPKEGTAEQPARRKAVGKLIEFNQ